MAVTPLIGNTMGAAFLGVIIIGSAILFGAIAVQVFVYYNHFPNDWRLQKIFVGMLTVLTVVQLAFSLYTIHFYVITNFGRTDVLESIGWAFGVQTALDVVTILSVQGLYAWRVQTLGKQLNSRVWPWVVVGIVGVGWVFGIVLVVDTTQTKGWTGSHRFHSLVAGSFAILMIIDSVIAVTLCYYLNKSRSIFSVTNNRLLRIMHYVLICGFLTSVFSLATLICFATIPDTFFYVGIEFMLPRLYLVSYMAMLNARRIITNKEVSSLNVPSVLLDSRSGRNSIWTEQMEKKLTIVVETEVITDQDAIPLETSEYYREGKASPQTSLEHHHKNMEA